MNLVIGLAIAMLATVGANIYPNYYQILFKHFAPPVYQSGPVSPHFHPYRYQTPSHIRSYNFQSFNGQSQRPTAPIADPIVEESINPKYKIVCYYESWAISRPEQGSFRVNDINPLMCTHLIYSYAKLDEPSYTVRSLDDVIDIQSGGYKNATDLKLQNPNLKVMIALGGWNEGALKYSFMARYPHLRAQFVDSVLQFVQQHHFDGVDINWAFPAATDRSGRCEDKDNFVKLIKELRAALSSRNLLLSAVMAPIKEIIDDGYNVPEINANLDFINVLAFNLRSALGKVADHHSPATRRPHDEWENTIRNIEFGIRYLMDKGADPSKLILGIPFFGVSFTLANENDHTPGSAAKGPGIPGKFTGEEGYLAYYEICPLVADDSWKIERDEYGKTPYAFGQGQWVGFDDEQSIENKMEFIKKFNLGGAMAWALDLDDYIGVCGPKSPLIRKIYSALCGEGERATGTGLNEALRLPYSSFRPQIPSQSSGPLYMAIKIPFAPIHTQPVMEIRAGLYLANSVCQSSGFLTDPADCNRFFRCDNGVLRQFVCPFGLHYNKVTYTCDWSHYASCETEPPVPFDPTLTFNPPPTTYRFQCPGDGLYPSPTHCKKYYLCANFEPIPLECPGETSFNKASKICDWDRNVKCDLKPKPEFPDGTSSTTRRGRPTPAPVTTPWPTWGPPTRFPTTRFVEQTTSRMPQTWAPPDWFTRTTRVPSWVTTTARPPPTTTRIPHWATTTTRIPPWATTTTRSPPWASSTTRSPPWASSTTRSPPWASSTTRSPPWASSTTTRAPQTWVPPVTTAVTRPPLVTDSPAELPPGLSYDYKVVCYFTNWAWYRPGIGKFYPENVDPALCTHIIYAFTVLDGENLIIKLHDPWADVDNRFFIRVVDIKKKNPKVKVILGLGGWTDSLGDKYSRLVNSPSARTKFISHAVDFINKNGFDGLDFDWEYPKCWQVDCKRGPVSDKSAFAEMVTELRAAFDQNTPRLLLTAAVSPSKTVIDNAYDVQIVAQKLDFINVMTYDFHGSWEKKTGHVAPLYYFPGDEFDYFNSNFTLHYYLELGAPRSKLIMGMPLYGQSWSLADTKEHGLNAQAYGPGEAGEFSRQGGMLSYYEICTRLRGDGWSVVRDPKGRIGPFAFKGNQWFSYDDIDTIRRKSEYVRDNKFGGAMIWALDFDDFNNVCCQGSYPLLKTINSVLRNYPKTSHSNEVCNERYSRPIMTEPLPNEVKKFCITSRCPAL